MRRLVSFLLVLSLAASAAADDLLPADRAPEEVIDHYIDARLREVGVSSAPLADDANLLRRTMLDLVGRIPTAAEARAYMASTDPAKRAAMVDQLMESPPFVRQQAAEFDALLMHGTRQNVRDYLTKAFEEKKSWDQMFRDLVVGEKDDAEQKRAIQFVKSRAKDQDQLTNDTSVIFFGVNVSCAKCHDHPLVSDWTQEHYYGMKSFFSRTYDVGEFIGEKDYGLVEYKTVGGEARTAKLMFLTGQVVDEPENKEPTDEQKKEEKKQLEELKKNKQRPPAPSFSRRAKLVEVALAAEKPDEPGFFARAIVNHVWHRLLGYGLVHPTDQMHSGNTPSHPELLTWLARDTQTHGYDLRRLIRGIVLSRAYARSSVWDSADRRPSDDLFAVGNVRPLKPWQYATSLRVATLNPDVVADNVPADQRNRRLDQAENSGRGLAGLLELPLDDFQVSVDEALLFSNSERIRGELLRDGGDTLLGKLKTINAPKQEAETALWNILARPPTSEEIDAVSGYLAERTDRADDARKQAIWAILTSSELRFNY